MGPLLFSPRTSGLGTTTYTLRRLPRLTPSYYSPAPRPIVSPYGVRSHEGGRRGQLATSPVRRNSLEASPLPLERSRDVGRYEPLGLPSGRRLFPREWRAYCVSVRGLPQYPDEKTLSGATDGQRHGTALSVVFGTDVCKARGRLNDGVLPRIDASPIVPDGTRGRGRWDHPMTIGPRQ